MGILLDQGCCPPCVPLLLCWEHVWSQTDPSADEEPQLIFSPLPPSASVITLSQERTGELGHCSTIAQPPAAPSLLGQGWDGWRSVFPCTGAEPCVASLLPWGGLTLVGHWVPTKPYPCGKPEYLVCLPLPGELLCQWGNVWALQPAKRAAWVSYVGAPQFGASKAFRSGWT